MTVKIIVPGEYNDERLKSVKRAAGDLHTGKAWYEASLVKDGLAEYPAAPEAIEVQESPVEEKPSDAKEEQEAEKSTHRRSRSKKNPFLAS